MNLNQRIKTFAILGEFLAIFDAEPESALHQEIKEKYPELYDAFYESTSHLLENVQLTNAWFTPGNVRYAFGETGRQLTEQNLQKWIASYRIEKAGFAPKTIAIIMAGNIPLVGFHDLLSVLISGHNVLVKLSSKDNKLIPQLVKILCAIAPALKPRIRFEAAVLKQFDAVIATGSNNSARYFEYYFGKYPHIIRKNRQSVAVLSGNETPRQMQLLASDILRYFGLGCRNVSKLYVPESFQAATVFDNAKHYSYLQQHNKFANNYDYNRAIYLMNNAEFYEDGVFLLKPDSALVSPVAVVHYEKYKKISEVKQLLQLQAKEIQCVVADKLLIDNAIPFGRSQQPDLWEYADDVDTLDFLCNL